MATPEHLPDPDWRQLVEDQDGVLARTQALSAGLSEDSWQWRLETGQWTRLLPGVAAAHSGVPSAAQCRWGAVLHGGRGAAITAEVALIAQGFRSSAEPQVLHLAVPEGRIVRPAVIASVDPVLPVQPHRVRGLEQWLHPAREPAVLRPAAAVLHAAAFARTDRAAEWRIAAAVQQRLVTPAQIRAAIEQMPRLRRRALVSQVLGDVEHGAHAQSELDFLRLLRKHGLPLPDRLQRLVRAAGTRYLDVWWEGRRVAVEIDGAHHLDVGQWGADVMRANEILVAERHHRLLLLRFTTGNLRHDQRDVVRQLRAVLL